MRYRYARYARYSECLALFTSTMERLLPKDLKEKRILVAYSGGSDSSLLLRLAVDFGRENGFFVAAAHVNHGIRGDEAIRDREFCRETAKTLGVPFFVTDADVPALVKGAGESTETVARRVRYGFFEQVMRTERFSLLLTAHNADDQLETLLFRLCRGVGPAGLCGIPEIRELGPGYALRPLLDLTKAEIVALCRENGIDFVTDSTNADISIARNRIRKRVVPELEALFDRPQEAANRFSRAQTIDQTYLESETGRILAKRSPDAPPTLMPLSDLLSLPDALRRRVIRRWLLGAGLFPEARHILSTDALIEEKAQDPEDHTRTSLSLAIPGGATVIKTVDPTLGEYLQIVYTDPDGRNGTNDIPAPLSLPLSEGRFRIPVGPGLSGEILVEIGRPRDPSDSVGPSDPTKKVFSVILNINVDASDTTGEDEYYFRTRRPGDKLLLHGMHRDLRKTFGRDFAPGIRESLPLLVKKNTAGDEDVIWAPGLGARDGCFVAPTATDHLPEDLVRIVLSIG